MSIYSSVYPKKGFTEPTTRVFSNPEKDKYDALYMDDICSYGKHPVRKDPEYLRLKEKFYDYSTEVIVTNLVTTTYSPTKETTTVIEDNFYKPKNSKKWIYSHSYKRVNVRARHLCIGGPFDRQTLTEPQAGQEYVVFNNSQRYSKRDLLPKTVLIHESIIITV
jgi:hypothetical protein